jgi:hypothetical protein
MSLHQDIVDLVRAGLSDAEISRRLSVDARRPSAIRRTLGLPKHRPGRKPKSAPDLFADRTQPREDGHLEWTGHRSPHGLPLLRTGGKLETAYRVAFRIRHGREPQGHVKPGCGVDDCVAPDHVEDTPMRERNRATYSAIFGHLP